MWTMSFPISCSLLSSGLLHSAPFDRESLLLKELDEYGRDRFRRDVVLLAFHGVPSGTPNRLADNVGRVVEKGKGGAAVDDYRRHADGFERLRWHADCLGQKQSNHVPAAPLSQQISQPREVGRRHGGVGVVEDVGR